MKLSNIKAESLLVVLILLTSSILCSEMRSNAKTEADSERPVKLKEEPKDDAVISRIRQYIYHFAEKISKASDIKLKRKISGQLPDSYPQVMVENAKVGRSNRAYWNKLLYYPTEVWRLCVYPEYMYKLNVMHYCEEKYSSKHPKKLTACKNTFCNVCCDHLHKILRNQAEKQIIGEMLWLKNNPGYNKILQSITEKDLEKCSNTCHQTYPVNFPVKLPPPPRDNKLGKSPETAAANCRDIQIWGPKNPKSGEYWVELGRRGKTKVYCDMEIDGGGWMLFFNYLHYPGQEVSLDTTRVPENLKMNHHVNLKEVGFTERDISELRFFCTERSNRKLYWHFKVKTSDFINVALTGDQRFLQKTSLLNSGYYDLPFPGQSLKWIRVVDRERLHHVNFVNQNREGGFWDSPFGNTKHQKFWTVKGNVKKGGRFECGTAHKDGATNPNAALVMTHHTVWMRGHPATETQARERFVSRNTKLNK